MRLSTVATAALWLAACAEAPSDDLTSLAVEDEVLDGKADGPGTVGVELKVTLPESQTSRARRAFRLTDERAERRAVWFYDDPALALLDAGVVLRARSIAGDDDDSTIKIRPLNAAEVDGALWELDGFKCEVDRMPDRSVESCSLTTSRDEGDIEDAAGGERDVDELFSREQEEFLAAYAPIAVDLDAQLPLGPIDTMVWAVRSSTLDRKVKLELWTLADGSTVLEVSTKVDVDEADEVESELVDYLSRRNLDVADTQETKTRAALESLVAAGVDEP